MSALISERQSNGWYQYQPLKSQGKNGWYLEILWCEGEKCRQPNKVEDPFESNGSQSALVRKGPFSSIAANLHRLIQSSCSSAIIMQRVLFGHW